MSSPKYWSFYGKFQLCCKVKAHDFLAIYFHKLCHSLAKWALCWSMELGGESGWWLLAGWAQKQLVCGCLALLSSSLWPPGSQAPSSSCLRVPVSGRWRWSWRIELETNLRKVWSFAITEKAPARLGQQAHSRAFTFETLLRHYAKQASNCGR